MKLAKGFQTWLALPGTKSFSSVPIRIIGPIRVSFARNAWPIGLAPSPLVMVNVLSAANADLYALTELLINTRFQ